MLTLIWKIWTPRYHMKSLKIFELILYFNIFIHYKQLFMMVQKWNYLNVLCHFLVIFHNYPQYFQRSLYIIGINVSFWIQWFLSHFCIIKVSISYDCTIRYCTFLINTPGILLLLCLKSKCFVPINNATMPYFLVGDVLLFKQFLILWLISCSHNADTLQAIASTLVWNRIWLCETIFWLRQAWASPTLVVVNLTMVRWSCSQKFT